jgi:iron complex outermembrane receptor protein
VLSGNVGIRLIGTAVATQGAVADAVGNQAPINLHTNYANVLPQMNLKAEFSPNTTVRVSAYQTLTRQDFGTLAPQVTLDFLFHIGGAGNPNLRPLSATNFDLGIEHHDAANNSSYVNLFFKRVVGFVQNEVHQEVYFGQTFDITRPENGGVGKVWGAEIGITRFLVNLPPFLKGLGFQANYTYVNSVAPSPISTATLPLEGLSKDSFNLIGFYERARVSARLAYNYRSPYVITSVTNGVVGFTSDWSQAQAVLDGSISYALMPCLKLTADFANLGNLRSRSYYTDPRLRHNVMETDRRATIGLRFTY